MKNIKSIFNEEQLKLLAKAGVELSDEIDYSKDDLANLVDKFTDSDEINLNLDENDQPTPELLLFESIVDKFYDKFDV